MKRRIGRGELSAAQVVVECPWEAHRMPVSEVLMSQNRWGVMRCRRVLVPIGIPENKSVGTLTDRQRGALVAILGGEPKQPAARHRPPTAARALSAA